MTMTAHERFLAERLAVECGLAEQTLAELRASPSGELASLARVASGAWLVLSRAAAKMQDLARLAADEDARQGDA